MRTTSLWFAVLHMISGSRVSVRRETGFPFATPPKVMSPLSKISASKGLSEIGDEVKADIFALLKFATPKKSPAQVADMASPGASTISPQTSASAWSSVSSALEDDDDGGDSKISPQTSASAVSGVSSALEDDDNGGDSKISPPTSAAAVSGVSSAPEDDATTLITLNKFTLKGPLFSVAL